MEWISTSEKLPNYSERVMLSYDCQGSKIIVIGRRICTDANGEKFNEDSGGEIRYPVTNWMPLPPLPKQ